MDTAEQVDPMEPESIRASGLEHAVERRWPRSAVIFTVALGLVALHLLAGFAVRGTGRSAVARLGGSLLTVSGSGAAVAAFRRSGHVLQGALAMIIGAMATIAGTAITVVRIVKVGVSGADLTGVPALLAGVSLLMLGAAVILARVRSWRRLWAIPVGLVVFYYLLAPLTMAVYVTHLPPTELTGRTPADVGIPFESVTMRTADGIRLAGWYVPSRNGAGIVVLHGSGSTRSQMLDHLAVLARGGYGVLALDARGHGGSGGMAMDLGWYGRLDVGAAVSFLRHRPDVDPGRIGVLGLSMGAEEALTAAAADGRIRAVVSEGASAHTFADARSLGAEGALSLPFYWLAFTAADLMSPASPPMGLPEAMARVAPRRVMLISGSDGAEALLNRRYEAVAPDSTELWELPDTPHTHAIWTHPDQWARRVVGFLDQALLG